MRLWILAILLSCNTQVANAEQNYLFEVMRCDKALEMILDSRSAEPVFLNPKEVAAVDGFLLGLGLLAADENPKSSKAAKGAAIGSLVFYCEDAPSRTIMELVQRYFRQ